MRLRDERMTRMSELLFYDDSKSKEKNYEFFVLMKNRSFRRKLSSFQ